MAERRQGPGLFASCLASSLVLMATAWGEARAEGEHPLDARTVMEWINEKYEELHADTRRVTMEYRTIKREAGKPDLHVIGTSVALQKDRKIRFEQAEDAYRVETSAEDDDRRQRGDHLLWIHDGQFMWARMEEGGADPEEDCGVSEWYVDHHRIPEEFGSKWTHPMMAAELPDEFLEHEFTLQKSLLEGEPVYVLRSIGRIPLSPENAMGVTLWVDPETYLIVRMEGEGAWSPEPDKEAEPRAYVDSEYDFHYDFGVAVPDSAFEIQISDRAQDLTDAIAQKIWEKLKWQGKLTEATAAPPAPGAEVKPRPWRCPPIG